MDRRNGKRRRRVFRGMMFEREERPEANSKRRLFRSESAAKRGNGIWLCIALVTKLNR